MSLSNETWVPGKDFDEYLMEHGIHKRTKILAKLEILMEIIQDSMQSGKISKDEYGNLSDQLESFIQKNNLESNLTKICL